MLNCYIFQSRCTFGNPILLHDGCTGVHCVYHQSSPSLAGRILHWLSFFFSSHVHYLSHPLGPHVRVQRCCCGLEQNGDARLRQGFGGQAPEVRCPDTVVLGPELSGAGGRACAPRQCFVHRSARPAAAAPGAGVPGDVSAVSGVMVLLYAVFGLEYPAIYDS